MSEALASPTLALLYLAQGHPRRARATLDEVLAEEPENGYALALLERMREPAPATLEVRFVAGAIAGAGELELRWSVSGPRWATVSGPRGAGSGSRGAGSGSLGASSSRRGSDDATLHLVLAFAQPRDHAGLRFTSLRCDGLAGEHRLPAPLGPASVAAALVVHRTGARQSTLAVAEALAW